MDLKSIKISFVQEFLRLQNKDIIDGLEKLLHQHKRELFDKTLEPMSKRQFNKEIDLALKDSQNDNIMDVQSLKNKIDKWA